MVKEIPQEVTQALAYLNTEKVMQDINDGKYSESGFHQAFAGIHEGLYDGTRNTPPEDHLHRIRGDGSAFRKLKDPLLRIKGQRPEVLADGESPPDHATRLDKMSERLGEFYQQVLAP